MFGSAQTKASPIKRIRKLPEPSPLPTQDYSCTLYQDYLVFYGGRYGDTVINEPCVYNLKTKELEINRVWDGCNPSMARSSHSACAYEKEGMILFYGGNSDFRNPDPAASRSCLALKIESYGDNIQWYMTPGIFGPNMPSPISNIHNETLYVYQPGQANGNFGSLDSCFLKQNVWGDFEGAEGDLSLSMPSDCAIFCDNNLYLFAENEGHTPYKRSQSNKIFEDVYMLDLSGKKTKTWRRISAGGQAPGLLTNVSMAASNGVIYVFGTSLAGHQKSVLWTYDTNEETWREVKEIGTLTAGANQRAVVYEERLSIVDYSYPNQTVHIQYHDLNGLNFDAAASVSNKQVCQDQSDDFIQEFKNLYNGRLFADISFEVEGEEIPAHKAILAYRSDYFMKMFTGGMSESHDAKITIPNIKSRIFKAILQYVYCNEIELDEQLALDLIPVVDEYLMKGLKGLCEKYLCKQLRKENVVDMLIVADRHEIEELKKACFRFILKNLGNIDENEEMMKLSKSLFVELLKFNSPGSQKNNHAQHEQEEAKSNNHGTYAASSKSEKKKAATPSQGFEFGAPSSGISFGATAQKAPAMTPQGFGFGFGTTTGATSGISFGATAQKAPAMTSQQFSFGTGAQKTPAMTSQGFSFGTGAQKTPAMPSQGFSFGATAGATSGISFGASAQKAPAMTSQGFGFGTGAGVGFGTQAGMRIASSPSSGSSESD